MPDDFSFAKRDEFGKINLSMQINRTAMLLSQPLDAGSVDIMRAQKILINAKLNAVDTIERMLQYYLKISGKDVELEALKKYYEPLIKKDMLMKEEFAEAKFGFLMEFISVKGWFIEDVTEETIGGPDDYYSKRK